MLQLFFDKNDLPDAAKLKDDRFRWLQEIGAIELSDAAASAKGFLFSYEHGETHLSNQLKDQPEIRDRPNERQALIHLDDVLQTLAKHKVKVPTPKTWVLEIDNELPVDLSFPLFVRTRKSSWKRGGEQAKVRDRQELAEESELLRRAFGWDAPIIVREWLDIAAAGKWMFGDAPQEVRTWVIDGTPVAWSFHYLHAVKHPVGFPPSPSELDLLQSMAAAVAKPFQSRLIAVDFVRDTSDQWHFMEAGPGAVAGTAHEQVFKFVAKWLIGEKADLVADDVGGPF